MKTPEEIKKMLKRCSNADCGLCMSSLAEALEYIQQLENHIGELTEKVAQAAGMIDKLPAVDAEPVRYGEWRRYPECGVTRCSVCDWSIEECFSSNYCPNCGAKMSE